MEKVATHRYDGRATLSIGGVTVATDDVVETPHGRGIVISLDPFADDEICVRLFTPIAEGSVLWFSFREVVVSPPAADV